MTQGRTTKQRGRWYAARFGDEMSAHFVTFVGVGLCAWRWILICGMAVAISGANSSSGSWFVGPRVQNVAAEHVVHGREIHSACDYGHGGSVHVELRRHRVIRFEICGLGETIVQRVVWHGQSSIQLR